MSARLDATTAKLDALAAQLRLVRAGVVALLALELINIGLRLSD